MERQADLGKKPDITGSPMQAYHARFGLRGPERRIVPDAELSDGEFVGMHQETIFAEDSPLTARQKEVLRRIYGVDSNSTKTKADVAREQGVSPRTIRRDLQSAFQKLRGPQQG